MIIIGEKINGTRKRVGTAIIERDKQFIQDLARKQAEAGSAYLDINAGTNPDREADDLVWLIKSVQDVVDIPLCLDSPNPDAVKAGLKAVDQTPMINSISGEEKRLKEILPLAAANKCPVIALCLDDKGIPETSDARFEIITGIIDKTRSLGLEDSLLYIDPLAMSLSTNTESAKITLDTIRMIQAAYPETHFTIGLSNISFGLPARKFINRVFLALAMAAGLDSAILDPLNPDMMQTILTADLVLGQDRFAQNFSKAYRKGIFG